MNTSLASPLKSPVPAPESCEVLPLPSDEDAECAVLGTLLLDVAVGQNAPDLLNGDEFYLDAHRAIFRKVCAVLDKGGTPDLLSVSAEIEADALASLVVQGTESAGARVYLSRLLEFRLWSARGLKQACDRLVQLHSARQLIRITENVAQAAREHGANVATLTENLRGQLDAIEGRSGGADELLRLSANGVEFAQREFKQPLALLGNGLLTEGELGMLVAATGVGKTFLGEQLAHAVASGELWLDTFSTPKGGVPVALLQLELSPYRLQQRRKSRYPKGHENVHTLTVEQVGRTINILDPSDLNKVLRWVRGTGAKMLVVDPLQETHDLNETNETFHKVVRAFRNIGVRSGAALFVVHHEGKENLQGRERSDLDAARGGTRLPGGAKLMFRVRKTQGLYVLTNPKASFAPQVADIYLRRDENGWFGLTAAPVPKRDRTVNALVGALLVAPSGGATYADLERASGAAGGARTRQAIRPALDRLAVDAGLDGWRSLNVGTDQDPRFVHPGASVQAHAS